MEKYGISVIEERGRYRYLHPDRDKRITEKALGTRYGKGYLEQSFLRKDPIQILYIRSHLRLVVDLQNNVKAMQSPGYAHHIKISNLQEMANTIVYVQEHGFNTSEDLKNSLLHMTEQSKQSQRQISDISEKIKTVNMQIHYTGQYYLHKEIYSEFLKSRSKGRFRNEHLSEIQAYEEARNWLKAFYPDGKILSLKALKTQKENLKKGLEQRSESVQDLKEQLKDLKIADKNVDAILHMQLPKKQLNHEQQL